MKGLITRARSRCPGVDPHPAGGERGRQGVAWRGAGDTPGSTPTSGRARSRRDLGDGDQSGNTLGYEPGVGRRTMRPLITAMSPSPSSSLGAPATSSATVPPDSFSCRRRRAVSAGRDDVGPIGDERLRALPAWQTPGDRRHRRRDVHPGRLHRHAGARRAVRHVVQQLPPTAPQDPGGGGDTMGIRRQSSPSASRPTSTRMRSPSTPRTTISRTSASP